MKWMVPQDICSFTDCSVRNHSFSLFLSLVLFACGGIDSQKPDEIAVVSSHRRDWIRIEIDSTSPNHWLKLASTDSGWNSRASELYYNLTQKGDVLVIKDSTDSTFVALTKARESADVEGNRNAIIVLFLLIILAVSVVFRLQSIRQLNELKTSFWTALHDLFLSPLKGVPQALNDFTEIGLHDAEGVRERIRYAIENGRIFQKAVLSSTDGWSPLLADLRRYASDSFERMGIEFELVLPTPRSKKPLNLLQHIFFRCIFTELVTNITQHSSCSFARIELQFHNKSILLVVQDDGVGFWGDSLQRLEKRMKERVKTIGGTCELQSTLGTHWRIQFSRT